MHRTHKKNERRGVVLIAVVLFLVALGGMAAALVALSGRTHQEHQHARVETQSFYAAEAGLNEAFATLQVAGEADMRAIVYPRALSRGDYTVLSAFGDEDPDLRLDRVRLKSIGDAGGGPEGVQLMVWNVPTGFFRWAVFGDRGIHLDSNMMLDSYDGTYGFYGDPGVPMNEFANIGSNGDIRMDSNTEVHGDVIVGPTGLLDDSGSNTSISGNTGALPSAESMDPIAVPAIPSIGNAMIATPVILPAGDYHFNELTIRPGGNLTIVGPARVVIDDMLLRSNGEWNIDASLGPVEIYGTGDFELESNSTLQSFTRDTKDVSINLSGSNIAPSNDSIFFNSNAEYVGTIYAPYVDTRLESNFEIFGAIRAGHVEFDSNARLHFDERLLYDPNVPPIYERVSWRRLSDQEIRDLGF